MRFFKLPGASREHPGLVTIYRIFAALFAAIKEPQSDLATIFVLGHSSYTAAPRNTRGQLTTNNTRTSTRLVAGTSDIHLQCVFSLNSDLSRSTGKICSSNLLFRSNVISETINVEQQLEQVDKFVYLHLKPHSQVIIKLKKCSRRSVGKYCGRRRSHSVTNTQIF